MGWEKLSQESKPATGMRTIIEQAIMITMNRQKNLVGEYKTYLQFAHSSLIRIKERKKASKNKYNPNRQQMT